MSDFKPFSQAVHKQFSEMSKHELFVVDVSGDDLFAAYLAAFPEGTNPIYRERTEHDCSCCKNFIRNIGNVVAVVDEQIQTVWDKVTTGDEYEIVATKLANIVGRASIKSLFRASEKQYGAESTIELKDGVTKRWNHFVGQIANKHYTKEVGSVVGEYNTSVSVFKRGLEELTPEAFTTVIDLIQSNNLYRGNEFLPQVQAFAKAQNSYNKLDEMGKQAYLWNAAGNMALSRFRNTAIGTLLVDLSAGVDLEAAVKSFESKVAPTNYKRPNALITQKMIDDAIKTIQSLDLESALERRFATIEDVSVNDILFVDNAVRGKMKGGIADLLSSAVVSAPIKEDKAQEIAVDDFLSKIVPNVKNMEILVKNNHLNNFMSITAPVYENVEALFKWNNNFAWSYDGNIADSLKQKVANLGGRVDGVLRFTHTWNFAERNASLMDLHVFLPGSSKHEDGKHDNYPRGQRVGWNNRKDAISGGVQDVDYTAAAPEGYVPVENITFPSLDKLKDGEYTFKIHNWNFREPTKGGFRAEIEFDNQIFEYDHPAPLKNKEWITLAVATLKNRQWSIAHKHPVGAVSKEKWGIATEKFTRVDTLMLSPNHWGDNKAGAKHVFFILDGCKNDLPTRGIYNEFLKPELEKHRKVFEVLGQKTMCQPTDAQLSGVGFTSSRGDSVVVKVDGKKLYNVKF